MHLVLVSVEGNSGGVREQKMVRNNVWLCCRVAASAGFTEWWGAPPRR